MSSAAVPVSVPMPSLRDGVVVALHSSAAGPRQWDRWAAALAGRMGFVTPALAGYAEARDWPSGQGVSLAAEARRIAPLLSLAHEGVHLVGHSYGGAVALEIARRWPERVRSLTLYEPVRFAVLRAHDATQWEASLQLGRQVGLASLSGAREAAGRRFVDHWSGEGSWDALTPNARARIAAFMPKVQAEFEALFADPVPLPAWAELRVPVRLLCGDRSPLPVQRIAERLAQVLPHAGLQRLPAQGHMAPLQSPQVVMRAAGLADEPLALVAAA